MKPFDFQEKFISDMGNAFRKHDHVIGCAATGFGKGVTLAEIARRSILKGNVICISCHRVEIFQQLFSNLLAFGVTPGIIAAGHKTQTGHQCYLSMVETFCRRMNKGLIDKLNINFFVLDEVHLGNYYKMVQGVRGGVKILGLTATPKSTGKPELKEYFDDIVCGISISELISIGRLTPGITYSIKHDFSKVKRKGNDFDDRELMKEFSKPKLRKGAVEKYLEHAKGRQAICYNVNVEQSLDIVRQFHDVGVRAGHVDGNSSEENRNGIFNLYRDGKLDIISNVGVATTGTDLPMTECIIQNFATMSLVKHVQTLGRGARAKEGKKDFIIIDMGRNWIRHDKYGTDIDWVDIFHNPPKAVTREPKKKTNRECDTCGGVIKFTLRVCPYCGDIISKSELEEKLMEGATLQEIREYKLSKIPIRLRKSPMDMEHEELVEYARLMNYKYKWIFKMKQLQNKKYGRKN